MNEETAIEIFVLDPRSTSLLPAKAFTPKALKTTILKMDVTDLPYPLESVVNPNVEDPAPTSGGRTVEDGDGPNAPIIGAVVGVVLIALVLAVWFYRRRHKNKRYIYLL